MGTMLNLLVNPKDWLSLAEAAAVYNLKKERLQKAAKRGTLRAVKFGSLETNPYFVTHAEMGRYLSETRRGPKRQQN